MIHSVIVALDFSDWNEALDLVRKFAGKQMSFKIGMELFYREGARCVEELLESGHFVFLDLKLHDIPNTVRRTMRGLAALGVHMVNVHAAGGTDMMKAAVEGLKEGAIPGRPRPLCLAVTQLTSISEQMMREQVLISHPLRAVVQHYARLAAESGLDGVVCSAWEVPDVKASCSGLLTVTPGIRPKDAAADDQKRYASPGEARRLGSSAIVVGRPITRADDPVAAYDKVRLEWEESL